MSGLAWATVGEMEPRVHQLEQSIEHGVPGKLLKVEACLGPAIQKAEELEKVFQAQVGVCTAGRRRRRVLHASASQQV